MATRNIVGNVPEPDELYGRGDFIAHLWRQIKGNNILLLAPRRFGKSGVMRHVLMKPLAGYLPVYLDLEDVDRPEEFVWRVTRELLSNDAARHFLQGVKGVPERIRDWVKDNFDEVGFEGAKVKFKESVTQDCELSRAGSSWRWRKRTILSSSSLMNCRRCWTEC